jgi:xylulokinase
MSFLAIDLGTQSIRAAVVDKKGQIKTLSQMSQEVDSPYPGWAQQMPEMWWKLTKEVIKQAVQQYKKKSKIDEIEGICTCGQMHGPVGIDQNGNITTKWTQIWMDKRSETICNMIRNNYDETKLVKISGNPITTGWPGVKIRWIKENQKEIYEATKYFLVPKDFINYKLTGIAATDHSEASGTYLYDVNEERYSKTMEQVLNIDLKKFAPIHESYDIIGTLKSDIAQELGLPVELPVIAGGGDFIVSLLGIGLVDSSTAVDMTGTSTLLVVYKDKPIMDPAIQNLRHVIGGWIPFTMLDCGGLAIKWCKDMLNSTKNVNLSYEEIIELANQAPIGSEGLLFYPYLLGERRKDNVSARGAFFNLSLTHQAKHFCRSIMEGVALALSRDIACFKNLGVDIKKVVCLGGATRNTFLYELKTNVTNLPHYITDQPESSLSGCGILTAYALGKIDNFEENMVIHPSLIIEPEDYKVLKYNKIQNEFNRMYEHMLGYWDKKT